MGRRKKEPRYVHRAAIAAAAAALFQEKGVAATSMDDIARAAGYSKATLYVYFANKEALVGLLALESMEQLRAALTAGLAEGETTPDRYRRLCRSLAAYQAAYPFYFRMALDRINIDFTSPEAVPEEEETYRVGEAINRAVADFLEEGMARGDLRRDLAVLPTIFHFWGALSGLIQLAASKEDYLRQAMGLTREKFLEQGFALLYRAIAADEKTGGRAP